MPQRKYLKESIKVGERDLIVETGKVAKQANGAVVIRYGETMVLVTAVSGEMIREGIDFFPLTVEYRESTYAAGRIPGNYYRREGRPNEKETLTSRLIDRPCRPLFPEGYKNEVQIIATVISADDENDPDVIAVTGASCALYFSDIPFYHPVGCVRVGLIGDKYLINPTYEQRRESVLDLVVAGTEDAIVMVEAEAKEVSERIMVEAMMLAHKEIKRICIWQKELFKVLGITKKEVVAPKIDEKMLGEITRKYEERLRQALDTSKQDKLTSYAAVDALKREAIESYPEEDVEARTMASRVFNYLKEKIFREDILDRRRRPDGRRFSEIRPISCEVGWLPRTHGSALFTRGETQAIVTTTLGTKEDEQFIDDLEKGEVRKRFMLHYNFPPYSVGEVGRIGSSSRREIGHGNLARRALEAVLPDEKEFPYTIRVVSEITESNGSSSMATVCGGSLSLMDAGVPIKRAVAGVAMGLVMEGNRYAILSDIAGAEDHYGDMDFKVAGTTEGITALQMDIKISGVNATILQEALEQARRGRLHILNVMSQTISQPRADISKYAPRIFTIRINPEKIREVIGPGGKVIRSIIDETGAKIDIADDGTVNIATSDKESARRAAEMIREITAEVEVGEVYRGKVLKVVDFGAFVEVFPGVAGLLHISEISDKRIRNIREELKEGQTILVKCIGKEDNKIKFSRKAVLKEEREKLEGVQSK
ncbi:MAG: polyribonucleotide nucleotidyltransferase [Pyrinomonadaceae bacterium]|nr:polyribonucleotide nucleotidyltransferase [Pyrinomonadaceae bacterium]MCX7639350.1 polyribonucleotide nucleotidyltransferase [Pyrinomonadaceae bacterium]MDW8305234.1 polyribonucleotide nucleotidyltransferase [Acidobacteriota bacterium]